MTQEHHAPSGDGFPLDSRDEELGRILEAYLADVEAGRPVDPESLLGRHPDLRDRLRGCLDILRLAGGLSEVRGEPSSAPTGFWDNGQARPGILLPEPSGHDEPPAITRTDDRPSSATAGRYRLFGELARGGMGAVLRARDEDLGRDVAVKVLLDRHRDDPRLLSRFIEEAQIGGQLQHPGIVPVFELGAFEDRRPYIAMKLVRGRTLAALLAARRGPTDDLPRFLGIFEQVCQTVAYAHARRVIHRDLKPSNVMVGDFGEVQVMDWGLAKVLAQGGAADDHRAAHKSASPEQVRTVRTGSGGSGSEAGSVLGTPAYMAPEQARGEIEQLDERADVFGLGAILCEILTGRPPYDGPDPASVRRAASEAETSGALGRLSACGADLELIDLAGRCLAASPGERPRDGSEVAARVTSHLAGVQARLQRARVDQAEAQARAAEARKRLKYVVVAAASLLLLLGGGGATAIWVERQARDRDGRFLAALDEAGRMRERLVVAAEGRLVGPSEWNEVLASVDGASSLMAPAASPTLARRAERLRAEVAANRDASARDAEALSALIVVRATKDDPHLDPEAAYAAEFAAYGIDPIEQPTASASAILEQRPMPVRQALAAALDDWSLERLVWGLGARDDPSPLVALARRIDPDPWRNDLRGTLLEPDPATRRASLSALAGRADPSGLDAESLALLGAMLRRDGEHAAVIALLLRSLGRHGQEVLIHLTLADALLTASPPRRDEALRFVTAARAIRPEVGVKLVHVLIGMGRSDEALAVVEDLVRRRPTVHASHHLYELQHARGQKAEANVTARLTADLARARIANHREDVTAHNLLGLALEHLGDRAGAITAYREATRLAPSHAQAHANLGNALDEAGDIDAAIAAHREAIRLRPTSTRARSNLGITLYKAGKLADAIEILREAIRLDPGFAEAHSNLGNILEKAGDLDGAIAAHREAIRLRPDLSRAHSNLANLLTKAGDAQGAVLAHREAVRIEPDFPEGHRKLGDALIGADDPAAAVVPYSEAVRLDPDDARARFGLGSALRDSGDPAGAIVAFREAARLAPSMAEAHCNLGLLLLDSGAFSEALAAFRTGHELGSKREDWRYPSAEWVAGAEESVRLAERLPAVLRGEDAPADDAERLALAQVSQSIGRFGGAARLMAEALASDPKLGDDRQAQHRYNAACAAVLASSGKGNDDPRLDDDARGELRRQALDWLKAELSAWKRVSFTVEPGNKEAVARTLTHWKQDADLASIRDEKDLAGLSEEERKAWKSLWAEVDTLLQRVQEPAS